MFTQGGFVGHEAGDRQISASRRVNDVIGLLHGDLAIWLSFGWWVDKHDRHHAHPNTEGMDPDIETGAVACRSTTDTNVLTTRTLDPSIDLLVQTEIPSPPPH